MNDENGGVEKTLDVSAKRYEKKYAALAAAIWNEVVRDGDAFPQDGELTPYEADAFFRSQSATVLAIDSQGFVVGLYILHPNNVGRCGHIANASYAVKKGRRGEGMGEFLVRDSLKVAKELGFRILQFNAVVATNHVALKLYDNLGFKRLGVVERGFLMPDGHYADIIPHWISL